MMASANLAPPYPIRACRAVTLGGGWFAGFGNDAAGGFNAARVAVLASGGIHRTLGSPALASLASGVVVGAMPVGLYERSFDEGLPQLQPCSTHRI